jgi:hypothetical protein
MREGRAWIRENLDAGGYAAALAALSPDDRRVIEGPLLAASTYSIATWDNFLDATYAQFRARTGESEGAFFARYTRESGSRTARAVYQFLLKLVQPTTAVNRMPMLFGRLYAGGQMVVLENLPGRCVLQVSADLGYRKNIRRSFPPALATVLGFAGASRVETVVTRDAVVRDGFVMDVAATYAR